MNCSIDITLQLCITSSDSYMLNAFYCFLDKFVILKKESGLKVRA